jgi:hypothetical protein
MLLVCSDEIDGNIECVFVADVVIAPLIVGVDVPDLEDMVVFVTLLVPVDVFELELDPENETDLLEVLESLPDSVSLTELVKIIEYVLERVDLLMTDKSG